MQCERAQEQFSDYIEEVLTPAMRQVFEQHLGACATCRTDFEQIRSVYEMLDEGLPMLEAPAGFRANVLNAIREQPKQETFLTRVRNWFAPGVSGAPNRVPAIGITAAALLVAIGGGTYLGRHNIAIGPQGTGTQQATFVPWQEIPVNVQNHGGILQGVRSYESDGKTYHVFGLHLPASKPATTATAYVIQSSDALTGDAALKNADNATWTWSGTVEPNTSVQVPVAVTSSVPAGTSMTLLVEWSDTTGEHQELCILPISDPSPTPMVVTAGESLYQSLQTVAVAYKTPILVNDAAVGELADPISQGLDSSDTTLDDSLGDLVIPANLSFNQQKDGSYLVDSN